ncbi:MAG: PaaI family thioesterase [Rhodobacteraceae bacterium]|nr:MAG: PaaI family thioesterase [Paracoccaceae bacterium]
MAAAREPVLGAAELSAFLDEVFPQVRGQMLIEAVGPMTARLRMPIDERHLRPGGTVSGPSMFTLADCAYYVATLGMIGREALTVTTSLTINFLAKPPAADLVCEARILRLGRVLSTGEATIWSAGRDDGPVAHAAVTYAIPPKRV